jgi:hypothetical protein
VGPPVRGDVKTFTGRAVTSPRMAIEMTAWTAMVVWAQGTSGMASVGLNPVALVWTTVRTHGIRLLRTKSYDLQAFSRSG